MGPTTLSQHNSWGEKETMPKRIQRKRTKGWKMPPNTVYVGRGTKWGNPFRLGKDGTAQLCVAQFRAFLQELWGTDMAGPEAIRYQLRGKDLACWCPLDQPCHADVLLEIANL